MRLILVCSLTLLLSSLALGQQPVLNYGMDYGPCLACGPFIPVLTTPSISLQSPPLTVGAGNATQGLEAGAANATTSTITAYSGSGYLAPIAYATMEPSEMAASEAPAGTELEPSHPRTRPDIFFAPLSETVSAGTAAARAKSEKHAARAYTNQDIDQLNRQNGLVKYRGKTVQME